MKVRGISPERMLVNELSRIIMNTIPLAPIRPVSTNNTLMMPVISAVMNIISTSDNRAQAQADDWLHRFGRERTHQISGMTTHPSLMLPKIMWICDHLDDASRIDKFVTAAEVVQAEIELAIADACAIRPGCVLIGCG